MGDKMASAASTNIVNSYYQGILRTKPSASLAAVYADQLDAGTLTQTQLQAQLLSSAQGSSIPALLAYDLLYNTSPTSSGLDFLTTYATAIQSGNYTYNSAGVFQLGTTNGQFSSVPFSLQNVYVNLGATFAGDPKSTFAATYGSLSQAAFVTAIYSQIFGVGPAASTQQFILNNFKYYTDYAGSTLGGYGAIAGLLLSVAAQSNAGSYPAAANNFLSASAISLAGGADTAPYGKELIASSANKPSSSVPLTTLVDNVTGNVISADLSPFSFNGVGPTLNVGDRITGSAGLTNNTLIINDQFGTGTDVIPAGVVISNVQNINLTTQGNAGGQSVQSQNGGTPGTVSGVFDVTTSTSTTASTISGVKAVNVISAGSQVDNIRVDPGSLNAVDVTVNHQHVNGLGGVQILGGNNVTVFDGDGVGSAGFGVIIGSATVVNTNDINLNPTGAVKVTEIGDNNITVNGGATVTIKDSGGGAIQVGQPTGAQLSYPSDEPVTSVNITNTTNKQAGVISVFGTAPVTNNGTTTANSTTTTISETALLGNAVVVGNVANIGGINNAYAPDGNTNVTVAAQIAVDYNYATATQTGFGPANPGFSTVASVVGGANVNVTTNANSVVVGNPTLNGNGSTTKFFPVANANASGNVVVNDTAVVGQGAGGASVTVFGPGLNVPVGPNAGNVTINNRGGAVTVGTVVNGIVIAPTGTIQVTNAAPIVYDNVINTGFSRGVAIVGGTTINVTTNAGGVLVGTPAAGANAPGSEPTGSITVVDTASPGTNVQTPKPTVAKTNIVTAGAVGSTVTLTIGANSYVHLVNAGDTTALIAADLAVKAAADPNATVSVSGSIITTTSKVNGGPAGAVISTGGATLTAGGPTPTEADINIDGGTTVSATSANGAITIGNGTTSTNPSGPVTAITNGIETGGQFASGTTVNGAGAGAAVTITTTGAGGAVVAGKVSAATGVGTPITGAVTITDTFAGTQNADRFTVLGGVGTASAPAVAITTTATSGAINVGQVNQATLLNGTGTGLANPTDFANGNVVINNVTKAGTGVAGAKNNVWGTGGATNVSTNGALATSVSVAGGGFANITDMQTTKATGGAGAGKSLGTSALATVFLDHVAGAVITSDALANLTVIDDPGTAAVPDTFTVIDGTAHALNLTIGNNGVGPTKGLTTTINDATASSVVVGDGGTTAAPATASFGTTAITAATATSMTFNTTAALAVNLVGDAALAAITLNNTGAAASISLGDLSGLAALSSVTAGQTSTGKVSATLNGKTSFNGSGSTGADTITLTSNGVTGTIQAGGGSGNTVIANYAASAADAALGTNNKVLGFSTLGVGANAVSSALQQTITVGTAGIATTGTANDTFTVSIGGAKPSTFTYTEQAGDSSAAIAAALAAGLRTKALAAGDTTNVVQYTAGSTSITITGAAAAVPVAPIVPAPTTSGAGAIALGAATATLNNYDATSFSALNVGPTAGPIGFSNVGNNETVNIAATLNAVPALVQPQSVTLAPTATANTLNLNLGGPDGPATSPRTFTNAVVNTINTQTVNVGNTGQGGTTKNTLTLTDAALTTLKFTGDESVTVTVPGITPLSSAVTTIDASATTNSTQPGSTNTVDTTGVAVAITGVRITGGAGVIKASGVQGLDTQKDVVFLTGAFVAGNTVSVSITTRSLAGIPTTTVVPYTVLAGDIVANNNVATQQAVATKIATAINAANLGVTASASNDGAEGVLTLAGSQTIASFTETMTTNATLALTKTSVAGTVATPQIDTLTLAGGLVAGNVVTVTLNGTTVGYTVKATDVGLTNAATNTNVAAGLAAAVAATPAVASAVTATAAAGVITLTATANGVAGFSDFLARPGTSGLVGVSAQYTAAADNYASGAGGGDFTLGAGGGFNPYAVNAVTSGVITTKFLGLYDSGYEQVDLAGSAGKVDTLRAGRDVIATFNGVNGGVRGFQITPSASADRVLLTNTGGYTELANVGTTKFDFTNTNLSHAVAALDPSGKLANNLANASYTVANGIITIVGAGNNAGVDDATKLAGAELIVAQAAALAGGQGQTAGTGIAALIVISGNTYAVSAALNNNLYTSFNAIPAADATSAPPVPVSGTPNSNDPGVSVIELVGVSSVTGFGSSVTATTSGGITSGIGATGAVLANVMNVMATHEDGSYGNAGKNSTYDDSGVFALDQLTTAAGAGFTTTYNGLAAAAQLNIAAAGNVGNVTVNQGGTGNSLIVDLKSAATIGTLTVNNDWAARLVADANATIGTFNDASNIITTVQATGTGTLTIGAINGSAVTTVDASGMTDVTPGVVNPARGTLRLGVTTNGANDFATPVNINGLVIKGALGGDTIFANGAGNVITVGSAVAGNTSQITGNVNITAAGNGDTVTLANAGAGTINFLTVGGTKDVISVDTGTNFIAGGFTAPAFGSVIPLNPELVALQSGDIINLADGGTDFVWVGANATVNLTGNTVTVKSVFGATASVANIRVTGDATGTTSAGFVSGAANPAAITTINGRDLMGANGTLNLKFLNSGAGGVEALAGTTAASAFVNIQNNPQGSTTLAAALDAVVNQSLVLDAQTEPGANTSVLNGALNLNKNSGVISWFQYQGDTYIVEAVNSTGSAAVHNGLGANDVVVKLTGLVNLNNATFAGGILNNV